MVIGSSTSDYQRLHNSISKANSALSSSIEKLSTGKNINKAADNPGAIAILAALESQTRGISQQMNTAQDEYSMLQVADGALSNTGDALGRISELATQAANGTLTDSDRQAIQGEIDQLTQQIDKTANNTTFNTKQLLDGSLNVRLSTGDNYAQAAATSAGLGISGISVTTQENASKALSTVQGAIDNLSSQRGNIGAVMNGLTSELNNLQNSLVNTMSAQSTIGDVDYASEIIKNNSADLQSQFAIKAFNMNKVNASRVLGLIGA